MIAQELEVSLHMAFVEARQQRHELITVEHLLLALLDNPSAAEVLRACSANIEDLRKSLANFIKDNTPQVAGTDDVDTQPTLGFQRVIQRAIMHVQSTGNGKKEVTGANVLVAIFGERESQAVYLLNQQNIARLDVVNVLDQKLGAPNPDYYSYTIGKHALWGASRTWRAMQDEKVRVFGLCPGLMLTSDVLDEASFQARRAANPLRRAIGLEDLLRALDLVLDAPALPGQDLFVDAGESLYARARDVAFEGEPLRSGG